MEFHLIVFLLLFSAIYGDACVTFNFEEEFEKFDPTLGTVCASVNNNWSIKQYDSSSFAIDPPHPSSETFISSAAPSSCVSSFLFDVEDGGALEVSIYMRFTEFMTIGFYNEAGQQVATWTSLANPVTANEWITVELPISTTTTEAVKGYLSLFATVTVDDAILVDSFRYIPPNHDADDIECAIYSDGDYEDTEAPTTENEPATTENDGTTDALTTDNESSTTENYSNTEAPTTENESSTTDNVGITETTTTESESSTTENDGTTEAPTTENESSTTENVETTLVPTTENYPSTTDNDVITEAPTTESESSTVENDGTTEAPTTENESSTTDNDDVTEAPTTENESSTTENDGTTEAPTTENESSTTDNYDITESPTTEYESSTTDNEGNTEAPTTEYESSTTDNDDNTEAPTTENEFSTTENDSTAEATTTENESGTTENDSGTGSGENTDSNEPGTTTENYTTESNSGEDTTEVPDEEKAESSFWTPLTIGLVATGSCLLLILIICVSYWCGKRNEKKKIPEILYLDVEELPKPIIVPRVKKVYTDSMRNGNPYAKDYF